MDSQSNNHGKKPAELRIITKLYIETLQKYVLAHKTGRTCNTSPCVEKKDHERLLRTHTERSTNYLTNCQWFVLPVTDIKPPSHGASPPEHF